MQKSSYEKKILLYSGGMDSWLIDKIWKPVWGIERSVFFNGREKWAKGFENQRV